MRAVAGAAAVAVIGPPYFPLDEEAQLAHFAAAAAACAPLPFYVYEFARTSGYPIALDVLRRLQDEAPNFVGLKVSDAPWDAFAPYLTLGLDVFVGPEALIHRGIEGGAIGAVSALASAFPEQVAAVVREPTAAGAESLAELRAGVERFPRQAAMKRILAAQGVPVRSDVRAPLRDLSADESRELAALIASLVGEALAVAALAHARASTLSTPGRRPSNAARSSSSAGERSAPIISSHTAACVQAARASVSRPFSVITAYVTRASVGQPPRSVSPSRSRPSRRRVTPEGVSRRRSARSIRRSSPRSAWERWRSVSKSFALRPWSASRRASIDRISEPWACRSRTKTVCAETCGVNT